MTIIERLQEIGYSQKEAKKIYKVYLSNNKLDGLEDYIRIKEALALIDYTPRDLYSLT